jgi:hypothetical protein
MSYVNFAILDAQKKVINLIKLHADDENNSALKTSLIFGEADKMVKVTNDIVRIGWNWVSGNNFTAPE